MRIFISWSQERSRQVAEALRGWLQDVNPFVLPWISSEDISPGVRWGPSIDFALAESRAGIICLTRENLENPWILFEAGAISKAIGDQSLVIPFLLDDPPSAIRPPLGQFNAVRADEDGTRRMVFAINRALPADRRMDETRLSRSYSRCWPELGERLSKIPATEEKPPEISEKELLLRLAESLARIERDRHADGVRLASLLSLRSNKLLSAIFDAVRDRPRTMEELNAMGIDVSEVELAAFERDPSNPIRSWMTDKENPHVVVTTKGWAKLLN